MSYVGLTPQQSLLSTHSETFSGDGSTLQFTLSRSVSRASDLEVFIGNTQQMPTVAYSAINLQLLFVSAPTAGTNNITVIYRAGALQSISVTTQSFDAGTAVAPTVNSTSAATSGIYWPNGTSMGLVANGAERARINSSAASSSTSTGAVVVTGGVGMSGNLYAGGDVRITSTTASTSASTGALVVSGGVGIAGKLFVTDDLSVAGDFTVNGTFTTTSSESLAIADPFVFLADTNSGDSYDQGFVGKFVDGGPVTRFHGVFRDVTDGSYQMFTNLTVQPTTVVDTGDASYNLANLKINSLSVSNAVTASTLVSNVAIGTAPFTVTSTTQVANLNVATAGTVTTAAQGNITSVGTLTGLTVSGSIVPNANGTIQLGGTSARWSNIWGLSSSAQYADLAENYESDVHYDPATVVVFGGEKEITSSTITHDPKVAGVISTQPAYLMNDDSSRSGTWLPVALQGRVPCKVKGPVSKGDIVVASDIPGVAEKLNKILYEPGSVIGKSLEHHPGTDIKIIEVVVGRN